MCRSVSFKSDSDLKLGGYTVVSKKPNYTVCSKQFLDGKGTAQHISISGGEGFTAPSEFEFQCDGFNQYDQNKKPIYKLDNEHLYQVTSSGVKPLFEESECWPAHIC